MLKLDGRGINPIMFKIHHITCHHTKTMHIVHSNLIGERLNQSQLECNLNYLDIIYLDSLLPSNVHVVVRMHRGHDRLYSMGAERRH